MHMHVQCRAHTNWHMTKVRACNAGVVVLGACHRDSGRSLTCVLACTWQTALLGNFFTGVAYFGRNDRQCAEYTPMMSECGFPYMHVCLHVANRVHTSTTLTSTTNTPATAERHAHTSLRSRVLGRLSHITSWRRFDLRATSVAGRRAIGCPS